MTQLGLLDADGTGPATRGDVHVHFGDWREQEPDWPRPFVFVSDVPYGIAYRTGSPNQRKPRSEALPTAIIGDKTTDERDAMMSVPGWKAAAVFGPSVIKTLRDVPPWGEPVDMLVLDKGEGAGMGNLSFPWRPNQETVAIYGDGWSGKRTTSILRTGHFGGHDAGRWHPHQKDVGTVVEIVSKAPPGLPIIDPFMGSGTTAIACALLGREFWGAEIDPQYWPVIRGRLASVGVMIP